MVKVWTATTPADSTTWEKLIEIDGTRGQLKSIGIAHGDRAIHSLKIIIDDEIVAADRFSSANQEWSNNGFCFDFPFEERLRIEGKDEDQARNATRYWINFVTGDYSDV